MYTNHKQAMRMGGAWLMLLAGLVLAPGADAATNETVVTNVTASSSNSVAADVKIDKALKALNPPVLQPVLYPPDETKGAPVWPLYKEQPPAAQQDFQPPKPVEVSKPREDEPRDEPEADPEPPPPPQPPPPPPMPCTPNHPNWPNC
jgi:hypothetical protein